MFGSAILGQALLSAMNFVIGLVLIRRTADTQYGYYVLVSNASLLLSALQNAFVQPAMVMRLARADRTERADLVGGLYREQRKILLALATLSVAAIAALWLFGMLASALAVLATSAVCAICAALYRESFRMVLLAHRRSQDVLRGDACYVVVTVCTVPLATLTAAPAASALLCLGLAATLSGAMLSRYLWRFEPWNRSSALAVLRRLAPIGGWTAAGSGTHWAFSQGYNYLVAAVLDVPSVAALAATRLLMMPVNLLSSGIISLMMPTALKWLHAHGAATLFRRLMLVAGALAAGAACYFALLWIARDFIFMQLLHKDIAHLDALLIIWPAVFLTMIFRDQLQYLPAACNLFRTMTVITAISAVISLATGYTAIQRFGVLGAPIGVLIGEVVNVVGICLISARQIRRAPAAHAVAD